MLLNQSELNQYVLYHRNVILPGPEHSLTLQSLDSVFTPMQSAPPYLGFGLVQNRSLLCVPLPHEVEHDDQVRHAAHEPLTGTNVEINLIPLGLA